MTNEEFVNSACPHSWFLVADELHNQAAELMKGYGNETTKYTGFSTGKDNSWDNSNRAVFLLVSFALENAIKAFIIYENPDFISNGQISKEIRSHKLSELAAKSNLIPFKNRGLKILQTFEDGNESWARYPCGLNSGKTRDPLVLDQKLWARYQWLIGAYGRRLAKLLSKHWHGPHGSHGKYEIEGRFLGIIV
jgi:hypothetical protein